MNKKAAKQQLKRVCRLMGIPLDVSQDIVSALDAHVREEGLTTVVTPNPEILMKMLQVPGYASTLQNADISIPDGNGLFWATSFLKKAEDKKNWGILWTFADTYIRLVTNKKSLRRIIPRLHHGSDTFFALHEFWNKGASPRIFYFGGEHGVEDAIAPVMQKRFPNVNIVGACGGYPFVSSAEFEKILGQIVAAKPEVVFVALPFPKQEQWLEKTREKLEAEGVRMTLGFGGTFDFAVGKKKRAPVWMHRLGLEWLWRLLQEPARAGRIWTAVFIFPLTLLVRRLQGKQDLEVL